MTPLLRLPPEGDEQPTLRDRVSTYLLVFLPWFVLYQAVETLGVPPDAVDAFFEWEARLPVLAWSEAIYAGTYVFVLAVPLVAKRLEDLRAFARGGRWATALIIPLYLLVPLIAPARPVAGEGFWQTLMYWERLFDQPITAFPAFHVVWACLAAQAWTATLPRLRSVWWGLAVAISASCITTGMHAVADIASGFVAYGVVANRCVLWRQICSGAESIANNWIEVSVGPARLLLHGVFIALGAVVGFAIAIQLAGPDQARWVLAMTCASVIGAAVWAQLIEGSPQLLRPYGYFGSVIGAAVVAVIGAVAGLDGWRVFTAFGVGGAFTQAIGRLRCLTQGCCHGHPVVASTGIHHTSPHSRVVRFTDFAGKPLHPTPVYSLIWMLLVGATLLRLWALAAPLQFIAGSYFILTGIGRFVEEHYRGEPQTPTYCGLRLYQWLAIAFVVGGGVLTTLGADPAPPTHRLDATVIPILFIVAALTYVAYGVDFPRSNRRFSRLA